MTFKKINGPQQHFCSGKCRNTGKCQFSKRKTEENKLYSTLKKSEQKMLDVIMFNVENINREETISDAICSDNVVEFKKVFENDYKEYVKEHAEKMNVLHNVAERNALKIGTYLIKECEVDIDQKNYDGFTPLHLAVIEGNIEFVKLLVENKANVNELEPDYYLNSMYLALKNESYNIACYLIKNGAQVFEKDADGKWDFCNNRIILDLKYKKNNKDVSKFLNLLGKIEKPN